MDRCLYCLEIEERLKDERDIEDYVLNGWKAAKKVDSASIVLDPELIERFRKLTSYELNDGRWCKGCIKKIK